MLQIAGLSDFVWICFALLLFLFSLVVLFKSDYDFFTVFAEITKSCHTPCTYIICKLRERESEREGWRQRGKGVGDGISPLPVCMFCAFVHKFCNSFVYHLRVPLTFLLDSEL